MDQFTRAQAAQLLKTNPRKIEGWVSRGILRPIQAGRGKGNPHQFTFAEIVRAFMIHETQENLGTQFIRPRIVSEHLHNRLSDKKIHRDRKRIEKSGWLEKWLGPRRRYPVGESDDLIIYIGASGEDLLILTREAEYTRDMDTSVLRLNLSSTIKTMIYRIHTLKQSA
ncbi:hypothetical protein ACFLQ0_00330 [Nitrospinota bacterium]